MKYISSKLKNINILEVLFIFSFAFAYQTILVRKYNMPYFGRYIIASIWVCIAGVKIIKDWKNKRYNLSYEKRTELLKLGIIFISPYVVTFIYSMFLFAFGITEIKYLGRCISCIGVMFITLTAVFSVIYLFRKRTLKLLCYSVIVAFILLTIINVVFLREKAFVEWFNSVFIDNAGALNPFEVHDLTFACGTLFLFFILFYPKSIFRVRMIIFSLLVIIMGFKRMQLLAIALMAIFFLISYYIRKYTMPKIFENWIRFVGLGIIGVALFYVWMIDSGLLETLCEKFQINTMDRINFYTWLTNYFDFQLTYPGMGFGVSTKLMLLENTWGIYFGTSSVHSEILRLFAELGMIGSIAFIGYYLVAIPQILKKQFNANIMYIYFSLQVYLFILHFTDNTLVYFTTQFVFTTLIVWGGLYKEIFSKKEMKETLV